MCCFEHSATLLSLPFGRKEAVQSTVPYMEDVRIRVELVLRLSSKHSSRCCVGERHLAYKWSERQQRSVGLEPNRLKTDAIRTGSDFVSQRPDRMPWPSLFGTQWRLTDQGTEVSRRHAAYLLGSAIIATSSCQLHVQ